MGPFEKALSDFALKAEDALDDVMRETIVKCGEMLYSLSPVDTTRFRSNWYYNAGSPSLSWRPEQYNVASVNGLADVPVDAAKFTHFLTNRAPYGPALERGHSQQAPQGFVVLTTLAFKDIVHNAARKVAAGGAIS